MDSTNVVNPNEGFTVKVSWVKNAAENIVENFSLQKVKESMTVKQLKRKIKTFVGRYAVINIVLRAKVLENEDQTLIEAGIKADDPISHNIFITVQSDAQNRVNRNAVEPRQANVVEREPRQANAAEREPRQANAAEREPRQANVAQREPPQRTDEEDEDEPLLPDTSAREADADPDERICRICFDGEEDDETGPLFSPCKCKGSMRYVHVNCLNHWRQVSVKKHYFQCPQCLYKYDIRREEWADYIDNQNVVNTVSVCCVLLVVAILGYIFTFTEYQEVIFEQLHWFPREYWSHYACPELITNCNPWFEWRPGKCRACTRLTDRDFYVDVIFFGCFLISFYGIYLKRERVNIQWMVVSLLVNKLPQFRFFMILGVGYCLQAVYEQVEVAAKTVITKFAESIREVN